MNNLEEITFADHTNIYENETHSELNYIVDSKKFSLKFFLTDFEEILQNIIDQNYDGYNNLPILLKRHNEETLWDFQGEVTDLRKLRDLMNHVKLKDLKLSCSLKLFHEINMFLDHCIKHKLKLKIKS